MSSAVMGEKDGIGTRWTYGGTSPCDGDSSGLYCFQLGEGPPLNPPVWSGRAPVWMMRSSSLTAYNGPVSQKTRWDTREARKARVR